MKRTTHAVICLLALAFALGAACQKNEQASVQPEKLASSSPQTASAPPQGAGGSVPGPLLPYADGHGPDAGPAPLAEGSAPSPDPEGRALAPAGSGSAAVPTAEKPAGGKAASITASDVKLLKAGAKPRRELRLHPKVGQLGRMQMVLSMAFDMAVDGKKQPMGKMPPMVMTMSTKVIAAEPEGDIRYQFTLTDTGVKDSPGVPPQVKQAMGQALGSLKGLSGLVVVSNRGITRETKISLPGASSTQTQQVLQGMEQAMQQLGAPLPKEPVGLGAQWQYSTQVSQNGISLTQIATYRLTKSKGKQISCKVKLVQKAPKQKVKSPVGVTVDLLSLKSKGGGKTKMRLDRLLPVSSDLKLTSRILMGMPKGQKMEMKSVMTVDVRKP